MAVRSSVFFLHIFTHSERNSDNVKMFYVQSSHYILYDEVLALWLLY